MEDKENATSSGGYGYENNFLCDTEKYNCPVCLLIFRDAMQTSCGHRFCQACISRVIGKSTMLKCPIDKQFSKLNQIFPDVAIRREVLSLPVSCFHEECIWQGDLREYDNHMETCGMVEVPCPFSCDVIILRRDVESHMETCPLRDIKCEHCHENIQFNVFECHLTQCLKAPVPCPVCFDKGFLREELDTHLDPKIGSCPETVIKCPYHPIGCDFTAKRADMNDHVTSPGSIANHLETVAETIAKYDTAQKDLKNLVTKLASQMETMSVTVNKSDKKLELCKKHLRERNVTGQLHWKISLRNSRHEFYSSHPFYTGVPGYRVIVDLDPDAQREGNIRFGLSLLRGEYDDQIMWPFNATCFITILDQKVGGSKPKNVSINMVVREVPRNKYGSRSDRLFKRILPQGLTRDELIGQNSRFIKNGCLFLEVSVVHCVYPMPSETSSQPMTHSVTPIALQALQNTTIQSTPPQTPSPVFSLAQAVSMLS